MPFLPPSAAGECTRRRAGEGCCRAAAGVCKRGYRTPYPGFLYPLLRLPLTFRWPLSKAFAAKNEESTDFTSVLSFFCLPWLCDCMVCRA